MTDDNDGITWKEIRLRLEKNLADAADTVAKLIVQRKVDEAIKYIENSVRKQVVDYENFRGTVCTVKLFPIKK